MTTDNHKFTVTVVNKDAPVWNNNCALPDVPVGQSITNGDISKCVDGKGQTVTFTLGANPPSGNPAFSITSNGILSGTPNDVSQVGNSSGINIPVIATTNKGSVNGAVNIKVIQGIFAAPTGTSRPDKNPAVTGSSSYDSESLVSYFTTNTDLVNDNYLYTANTTNCDAKGLYLKLNQTTDSDNQKVQLILDNNKGLVPDPSPNPTMSCTVGITATSKASTGPGSATVTVNVQKNGIIWLSKSLDQLTYLVPASPYATIDNTFVIPQGDGLSIDSVAPVGNLPGYLTSQPQNNTLVLTADTGESQLNNVDANCGANVSLRATASDQSTADKGFSVCLKPNADLKQSQWKKDTFIAALTNQDVPRVTMDPNVPSTGNAYVTKTLNVDGSAEVKDIFSDFQMGTQNGACGNLSITSDGYLQGKITNEGTCTFSFSMYSKARGQRETVDNGKIVTTTPPLPSWTKKSVNGGNITLAQGFGGDHTQGIQLPSDIINNNGYDWNSIDAQVYDGSDGSGITAAKWQVATVRDSVTGKPTLYLYRKPTTKIPGCGSVEGCFDANDVGTNNTSIMLRVLFNGSPVQGQALEVDYNVIKQNYTANDPNGVTYRFGGLVDTKVTVPQSSTQKVLASLVIIDNGSASNNDYLKTWVGLSPVLNDTLVLSGATILSGTTEKGFSSSSQSGAQYKLDIKDTMNNATDPNTDYNTVRFKGLSSKVYNPSTVDYASSDGDQGIHIGIYPNAVFASLLPDRGIVVAPDNDDLSGGEGKDYINIDQKLFTNAYADSSKIPGLDINCAVDNTYNKVIVEILV